MKRLKCKDKRHIRHNFDVLCVSGPLASFLTNHLGWRLTTVIGSVLAAAGFALSAVAPNVIFLYLSAGVLIGLGLGIIYLPRLDCITQYFDKKRPFVTGVAICGSGIGTFIFAPLTEWLVGSLTFLEFGKFIHRLLEYTDWQMALIILSGICLLNCGFGLLFKPLPTYQVFLGMYHFRCISSLVLALSVGYSVINKIHMNLSKIQT